MKLTTQHILELLDSLEKGVVYDYVHSKTSKVALLSVDLEEKSANVKKITKNDPFGKEAKFTTRMFEILENGVVENKPFSIDVIFNNSGSNRSALEALLARTSEFYACKVGSNKHLVWVPTKPHEVGTADTWEDSHATPPSIEQLKEAFREYLLEPERFNTPGTGQKYWTIITSDRAEIQFLKEIILDVTSGRTDDIFEVYNKDEATHIWNKAKTDERNKEFQNSIVSAIIGKYKDFLGSFTVNRGFSLPEADVPLQVIYYGAPGTGKSHRINEYFKEHAVPNSKVFRTTFHPDTDYASFVGSYKPTAKYHKNDKDGTITHHITYEFIPQVFTKAYVEAWRDPDEDVYLVIEESNRGTCAQIFGDLFQLLDRLENGQSEFPIIADNDLEQFLLREDQLGDDNEGIEEGKLKLPGNLHIWATMNTSDQSLFLMDSAFKRRWEQEYVRIDYSDASNFILCISGEEFDWGMVLRNLNEYIKESVHSTNKLLGNRFVKPKKGNVIDYKVFRDKVLFYLFGDVFKDDDSFASDFFNNKEGYEFFEDLCENDDPQFSSVFIHNILKVNSINGASSNTPETDKIDEEAEA